MKILHQDGENAFAAYWERRAFLSSIAGMGGVRVLQGQALPATDKTIGRCASPASAEPWSRFRGPNGSGIGTGTGYPIEFGSSKNIFWKRPFPAGKSSPVLTRDSIFLTADEDNKLQVISIDRVTGKTVWQRALAPARREYKNPLNHGASSSPATDGTNVYAFFGDYGLVSYDLDGKERWKSPMGPFSSLWGMATSPVVASETIVLLLEGIPRSYIIGFDRHSGRKKWEAERPPFALNYSTPIVRTGGSNECEVLALGPNELVSYDSNSGEPRWSAKVPPGTIIASPVLSDDHTLVSMIVSSETRNPFPDKDGDGAVTDADIPTDPKDGMTIRLLRTIANEMGNRDGKITNTEWNSFWSALEGKPAITATNIGVPGEKASDRGTRWSYTKGIARVATPLVYQGVLYYINMGGILTSLNAKTGEVMKVGRLEGALDNYYASPVAADGRVYFASETGKIVVVKAGAEWSILACNDLAEPCYATPALSEGKIFVRTSESLACYGTRGG